MASEKKDRPISAIVQDERLEREAVRDDITFFQAMIEAGYEPETKTEPQGSTPMLMGHGMMSPGIRSSADF